MTERRAVLVTGAGRGIGRAIASAWSATAYRCSPSTSSRTPTARACRTPPTSPRARATAARSPAALERFGRLDAVVANAGIQHVAPVAEFDEDQWDRLIAVLLTSPFLLAKHAWPALKASGEGRFVAIASAHALAASPFKSAYVSAKHGVLGLVKTLALEGAPDGIAAVAVCPGYVRTPLVERQIAEQAKVHGLPEDRVLEEVILAPHAIKRLIEPDEVADAVAYLLGPGGRTMTGVPLTMDLGWTAR